nr:hypothetical protein [Pseudodesulfovibrio sp.]
MPERLTPDRIKAIVSVINDLTGKITWDNIVEKSARSIGIKYSRQTLQKYDDIKSAYYAKKDHNSESQGHKISFSPQEMKKKQDRISALEDENAKLKLMVSTQAAQLVKWAYNAASRNLTKADLEKPMPPTERR